MIMSILQAWPSSRGLVVAIANTQGQVLQGEVEIDLAKSEGLLHKEASSASIRGRITSVQVHLQAVCVFKRGNGRAVDFLVSVHLRTDSHLALRGRERLTASFAVFLYGHLF